MSGDVHRTTGPHRTQSRSANSALAAAIRRAYFAELGAAAARYQANPDRFLDFCLRRDPGTTLGTARLIGHLDDLLLAAACINDVAAAWADLLDRHERALAIAAGELLGRTPSGARSCSGAFAGDGPLAARRWLIELRRISIDRAPSAARARPEISPQVESAPLATAPIPRQSLAAYVGAQPLRRWLAQRLHVDLASLRRSSLALKGVG
ncbi:MAG TPA: hypothetical protein PKC43_03575 [Phycisphaerales bacterium]|nr:hypothetical protein [Phycisphaerales bacterium]HMP36508.1 hypothetical protein [Phycisphaerales bacterium]